MEQLDFWRGMEWDSGFPFQVENRACWGCDIMDFMRTLDIKPYLLAWKKRIKIEEEEARRRVREALRVAFAIAKTLVEEGKARRVYLFGSLAFSMQGQRGFGPTSDIDLAVEAIPRGEYFRVLAEVNRMSDFEVDLVDLEACPAPLREAILKKGVLLYGEEGGNPLTFGGD
jgi:predicted nucleotidyltransferase